MQERNGVDQGGISTELFALFFEQLSGLQWEGQALFAAEEGSSVLLPVPSDTWKDGSVPVGAQQYYTQVGRSLLLAIMNAQPVPSRWASLFMLKYVCSIEPRPVCVPSRRACPLATSAVTECVCVQVRDAGYHC